MKPYLDIEQDDFDIWLRSTGKQCGDNESCYEWVWQQVIKKIARNERESRKTDYAIRIRDSLEIMICYLVCPIQKFISAGKTK